MRDTIAYDHPPDTAGPLLLFREKVEESNTFMLSNLAIASPEMYGRDALKSPNYDVR